MTTDPNRDFANWLGFSPHRFHFDAVNRKGRVNVIVLPQAAKDFDRLIGSCTALFKGNTQRFELHFVPACCSTENHTPAAQLVDGRERFGNKQGIAHGKHQHGGP